MFFECEDLQVRVTAALTLKHEIQFRHIIFDLKTNPNTPQECFNNLSIFEKVLETPCRSEFIELCISNGSDFFRRNDVNEFPLHYAMSSMCPENVKSLVTHALSTGCVNSDHRKIRFSNIVNEKLASGNNYLHNLVSAMNENNFRDVSEIVKVLVKNGCSMNTPNDQLETPFYSLLKIIKMVPVESDLVEFVLVNQEIDFFSNKSTEIVNMMEELGFGYRIDRNRTTVRDSKFMLRLLENRDERKFIEELPSFQSQTQTVDRFQEGIAIFLEMSAATNLCEVVAVLLERGADVNSSVNGMFPPAFTACMFGHFRVLEIFMRYETLKLRYEAVNRNLLHQICMTEDVHGVDRQRCFSLIVNDHRCTLEIINGLDTDGKSPLYYACSNGLHDIADNLLKRGAFIGHPSVVDKMEKELLEKFLDSCIKPSTDLSDTKCEIHIDFRFLMPPQNDKPVHCEVESIQKLAESDELHELLLHPAISTFLQFKWRQIKWIAFINVFMYLCFMLYLGYFIVASFENPTFRNAMIRLQVGDIRDCSISGHLKYLGNRFDLNFDDGDDDNETTADPDEIQDTTTESPETTTESDENQSTTEATTETDGLGDFINDYLLTVTFFAENQTDFLQFRICVIGTFLLALYELIQLLLSPKKYLFKLSNWLDLTLIYLSFSVLLKNPFCVDLESFLNYSALTILVMSAQTVQLIAKVSIFSMAIHMAIFKKVFVTFLKIISLYTLPILAFAMSFYTLSDDHKANQENQDSSDSQDARPFSDMYISIITTVRMMLADFDGFTVKKGNYFSNSLFFLFIVLVSIVLLNLLNALAISDTEKIMKHAELVDIKKRISLLYSYEKLFRFCNVTFANIFPQLNSFDLRPHVDRTIIFKRVKPGNQKVEAFKTKGKLTHGTKFEKSGYTMGKNDFNKIIHFVTTNHH